LDDHREVQELLPWYVTGKLDPAEQRGSSAHVEAAQSARPTCASSSGSRPSGVRLPVDVEEGWDADAPAGRGGAPSPVRRLSRG
jgi:hypothetical protein